MSNTLQYAYSKIPTEDFEGDTLAKRNTTFPEVLSRWIEER